MPRPFAQTFNWLYSRLPFSDTARTRLRVWAEAIRRELLDFQTEADEVYDGIFITEADGTDLDEWGEVIDIDPPRGPAEGDAAFRARLLTEWQTTFDALTVTAVTGAVDALGAGYVPVLSVDTIAEHYKDRLEDGVGAANDYDLGDRWGLARLDLSTFAVEIDRIPTAAEAQALITAIGLVRPAQTRGFLVVPLPAPPGTPPRYRLYGTSYSDDVAPWLWDDNIYIPDNRGVSQDYQLINDGPPPVSWEYAGGPPPVELYGDASDGAVGAPHLCIPRQDLDPVLLDYRDMYVECSLKVTGGAPDTAGIALRFDDVTREFYYLAFRWSGTAWEYSFIYYDGAAMNAIINWTATGTAMDVYKTVQTWLENDLFTLIINGVVLENKTDIKRVGVLDITADGEWGFCTDGTARDIYIDWWRMW